MWELEDGRAPRVEERSGLPVNDEHDGLIDGGGVRQALLVQCSVGSMQDEDVSLKTDGHISDGTEHDVCGELRPCSHPGPCTGASRLRADGVGGIGRNATPRDGHGECEEPNVAKDLLPEYSRIHGR